MYKFILSLFYSFYLYIFIYIFLPTRAAANPKKATGLYEWKITTEHTILTIMFKNILRTF